METRVCEAVNKFNGQSVLWMAWVDDDNFLGVSASFTFGARSNSPQRIKSFLAVANQVFFDTVSRTGLDQIVY